MATLPHNFFQILQNGIIDNNHNIVKIDKIIIPRIQRAYAQGRKSEKDIREQFLTDIFEHLEQNQILEMNFVYGSTPSKDTNETQDFELLDGQQRLTTLFLLYWYIANVELEQIPNELNAFEYQTRTTTTDFIKQLVKNKIEIISASGINPDREVSAAIRRKRWYTIAFQNDATINAMLNMLDDIHIFYKKYSNGKILLFERLNLLQFYVLPLEGFGLSEELYIKMNARGLPLTPFENFKSDLIKYMQSQPIYCQKDDSNKHGLTYYQKFAAKIDSVWIDLFWDKNNTTSKEYCSRFFRFFYRYFAMKYILEIHADMQTKELQKDKGLFFFDTMSETKQDQRYLRFEPYQQILDNNNGKDYFKRIEIILDVLNAHYNDLIRPLLQNPFNKEKEEDWWDFYSPTRDSGEGVKKAYTRINAIVFSAVVEYIEALYDKKGAQSINEFKFTNFKRWMRIVWNVVENTNIDGIRPQTALMRRLTEIIHRSGATDNIYAELAKVEVEQNLNRAIVEEISKAKTIVNRPSENWEETFVEAERNEFLRGMIGFFFSDNISIQTFKRRVDTITTLFDKNGISVTYRKDSILLRAMLAQLTTWDDKGLAKLAFTENVERNKTLKNLLASKHAIRELFRTITDLPQNAILDYLQNEINKERYVETHDWDEKDIHKFQIAYNRLRKDILLHQWLKEDEKAHNTTPFCVQWLSDGRLTAHMPNKWYSIAMLDSNRDEIANRFACENDFRYEDKNQQKCYNSYQITYGYNIDLTKDFLNFKLKISFRETCDIYVYAQNEMIIAAIKKAFNYSNEKQIKELNWVRVKSVPFDYTTQYNQIVEIFNDIIRKLESTTQLSIE